MKALQFVENIITATGYHSSHKGRYRHADGTPYGSTGIWRVVQSPTLYATAVGFGGGLAFVALRQPGAAQVFSIVCLWGLPVMGTGLLAYDHFIRQKMTTTGIIDSKGEHCSPWGDPLSWL